MSASTVKTAEPFLINEQVRHLIDETISETGIAPGLRDLATKSLENIAMAESVEGIERRLKEARDRKIRSETLLAERKGRRT